MSDITIGDVYPMQRSMSNVVDTINIPVFKHLEKRATIQEVFAAKAKVERLTKELAAAYNTMSANEFPSSIRDVVIGDLHKALEQAKYKYSILKNTRPKKKE